MDMLIVAIPLFVLIAAAVWIFKGSKKETSLNQRLTSVREAPPDPHSPGQKAPVVREKISQSSSSRKPASLDLNEDAEDSEREAIKHLLTLLPPRFIVLDLETTGLSPYDHEIIEIGAIDVVLGRKTYSSFSTLVRPENRIPRKITEITGITQAMVTSDGMVLDEAFAKLLDFLVEIPIVTYNASFDMGFLHQAAGRLGYRLPNRYCCALKTARQGFPNLPSYRLSYLSKVLNIDTSNEHRAVADCCRTLAVFCAATRSIDKRMRWSLPPQHMRLEKKSQKSKAAPTIYLPSISQSHEQPTSEQ